VIVAPFAQGVSAGVSGALGRTSLRSVAQFSGMFAGGATGSLIRAGMGGKVDAVTVIADAFGNALGNSLAERFSGPAGTTPGTGTTGAQSSSGNASALHSNPDPIPVVLLSPDELGMPNLADLPMPNIEYLGRRYGFSEFATSVFSTDVRSDWLEGLARDNREFVDSMRGWSRHEALNVGTDMLLNGMDLITANGVNLISGANSVVSLLDQRYARQVGGALSHPGQLHQGAVQGVSEWFELSAGEKARGAGLVGMGLLAGGEISAASGRALPRVVANSELGLVELNPRLIRTAQTTVKQQGETLPALVESMKQNGFVVEPNRLIDVVRMPDGQLTSLDTTRILAAERAGVNVQAQLWEHTDLLPDDVQFVSRFIGRNGDAPVTFGDAVINRVGRQNGIYPQLYPYGSWFVGTKY
jgi:hypothetical protein